MCATNQPTNQPKKKKKKKKKKPFGDYSLQIIEFVSVCVQIRIQRTIDLY